MFGNKAAMQAGILLMNRIRVFILETIAAIDFFAAIATSQGLSFRVS
jgi:hypothetical protein